MLGRKLNHFSNGLFFSMFVVTTCVTAWGQDPTPTPTPRITSDSEITATTEIGVRGVHVNGNDNKYRSDLNYRPGLRVFDSSLLFDNKGKNSQFFDSALVTTSGWGGDPTGMFRFNLERTGFYKFDSNIRRVKYFNVLNNHALSQHNANTDHGFGDFDLTIFPERESLRFRLGYSFNRTGGPAGFTTRAYSDEFGVLSRVDTDSDDFRAGVEGKIFGFNLGLNYGLRKFNEDTRYFIEGLNLGNNPTNNPRLFSFDRRYPIDGLTNYVHFNAQRTFVNKVDFTARLIHSQSSTEFSLNEILTGREGNTNNQVILDRFDISGSAKRFQTRGDLGATFRVTKDFRISNTFSYDQFNISGANAFFEEFIRRNAANAPLPTVFTRSAAYRLTSFQRSSNLLEADYQFGRRFGVRAGWRYTQRSVDIQVFDRQFSPTVTVANTVTDHDNSTHTLLAGFNAKPFNNWVIFGNVEHGDSDNYFTRLANYNFTNVRLRTRVNVKNVSFNASYLSKSNDNPGRDVEVTPSNFSAVTRSHTFTVGADWSPMSELSLSGGYTFQHLNARADIIVPLGGVRTPGISEFYIRDSYFHFDVHAKPIRRVSVFASYRINDDDGQGSRVSTRPQDIITSYPMRFQSPEVRLAIRLTNNIDWNVGYQYYDYKESMLVSANPQNYNAHLPYTSLRFYFGRAVDR